MNMITSLESAKQQKMPKLLQMCLKKKLNTLPLMRLNLNFYIGQLYQQRFCKINIVTLMTLLKF